MRSFVAGLLLPILLAGCGGPRESAAPGAPVVPTAEGGVLSLAPTSDEVATIQLYRTGDAVSPPILELGGGQTLTLEFDLLRDNGRPLSVYFYHADRSWRRDLLPIEYLEGFRYDALLDYRPSGATEVPYVHYEYRFPNQSMRFLMSGNYILRVTEQGREEDVLFETPFFISEQLVPVELDVSGVLTTGRGFPTDQPIASFEPPADLRANIMQFATCFVRNGRFEQLRCTDRAQLAGSPGLEFYLDEDEAFLPQTDDFYLDLSNLRVGTRIVDVDRTTSPYFVVLEPDLGRFAGSAFSPDLLGQPIVEAVQVADPDVSAEYVRARFAYVPPDDRRLLADVLLTGSFNGWRLDPDLTLDWVPERARYEADVILKQGRYQYRYSSLDDRWVRAQAASVPRGQNRYAAFVYYEDLEQRTDRLIAVRDVLVR